MYQPMPSRSEPDTAVAIKQDGVDPATDYQSAGLAKRFPALAVPAEDAFVLPAENPAGGIRGQKRNSVRFLLLLLVWRTILEDNRRRRVVRSNSLTRNVASRRWMAALEAAGDKSCLRPAAEKLPSVEASINKRITLSRSMARS